MNVDELRERLAAMHCMACESRADEILAAVAECFPQDQVDAVRAAVVLEQWEARTDDDETEKVQALADTLAALRRYAQPKEGSNG